MRHHDLDMTWMQHGECLNWPQLGWTKDHRQVGLGEESTMAVVCDHCPVRAACEQFVEAAGITGGFWAGHHRTYFGPCLPLCTHSDRHVPEPSDRTGEAA